MTPAELEERRLGIGGSDIPAILGLSKSRTPLRVWLEKLGEVPDEDNEAMWWGRGLEPLILRRYSTDTGWPVYPGRAIVDPARPWHRGTIDGEVSAEHAGVRVLLEAKSCGILGYSTKDFGPEGSDHVPDTYWTQCQWYLSLDAWDACHLLALIAGRGLVRYVIPPDVEFQRWMLDIAGQWWERFIVGGQEPDVDWSDDCARWLARKHPKPVRERFRDSDKATDAIVAAYRDAHERKKAAERDEDEARNHLRATIGDDPGVIGEWGKANWFKTKTGRTLKVTLKGEPE